MAKKNKPAPAVPDLLKQLKKQSKKLKKAAAEREELLAKVERHKARAKAAKRKYQAILDHPAGEPSPVEKGGSVGPDTPVKSDVPDDSWTVARLRAEAKKRGVTGYSRLTKAQLLAALIRP